MNSAPIGKWVVVRSDRLLLSVDKADHLYYIGRSRQLPSAQLLSHKYISREQLAVVWHPPHLFIAQIGRNPSFLGPACEPVQRLLNSEKSSDAAASSEAVAAPVEEPGALIVQQHAQLRFTPSTDTKEAVLHRSPSGFVEVKVPLCDPRAVTQPPDQNTVTASTIYFPDELGLPTFTVRFESADVVRDDATAAATTKTAAEMLAVPAFQRVEADEDDELSDEETLSRQPVVAALSPGVAGDGGKNDAEKAGGERPEWRGLLDAALREQQRKEATRLSEGQKNETAPADSSTAVVEPPPAPSTSIPFGAVSQPRPTAATSPAPAAEAPACAERHKMGHWEWKSHAKGPNDDPKSWRKYSLAVAELLEKAYCNPSVAKITIPDSVMFDKPGAKGSTYGVCFAEKALDGAMLQYALKDPGRFRLIRRTGGSMVDRKKAKKAHVIPSSSDSESEESFSDSDSDSESDSEESVSSTSSSESDEKPQKKRRHH